MPDDSEYIEAKIVGGECLFMRKDNLVGFCHFPVNDPINDPITIRRLPMNKIRIMRAEEEWQRAGAYSVRIQGMNRQYHISLRDEFDEHDGDESKYIVLLDDEYPVATCRFYELNSHCVIIGRVVVLLEYRNQHLGSMVIKEAEKWIEESGYSEIRIDSRVVAVGFYEKLGYRRMDDEIIRSWSFECVRMNKKLK